MKMIESRGANIIGFQATPNYLESEKDGRNNKTVSGDWVR